MEGFIKTESSRPSVPKLSGAVKTAVFLGEIGSEASRAVLSKVRLTDSQLTALNKAFKSLGEYNPHNEFHVLRENAVLEEAANFGKIHRIYPEHQKTQPQEPDNSSFAEKSPEDIAKFLSAIMHE